jgi:hypothetical protein
LPSTVINQEAVVSPIIGTGGTLGFETIYHNPVLAAIVARKYVASENLAIFHKAGCKGGKISEENVVHYPTREEAIQAGKRPCRKCKP